MKVTSMKNGTYHMMYVESKAQGYLRVDMKAEWNLPLPAIWYDATPKGFTTVTDNKLVEELEGLYQMYITD